MIVIINIQNISKTRKNKGLSFNSVIWTRLYSSLYSKNKKSKKLDSNWVTWLVDAEGSFIVFIKLNPSNNKVKQVQLSFEINLHVKDLYLFFNKLEVYLYRLLENMLDWK